MALTRPRLTQIQTDVVKFDDPIIELNAALAGANTTDIGIVMNRGTTGDNVGIFWDASNQQFAMVQTTADGDSSGDLVYSALADLQVNSISTAGFTLPTTDGTVDQIISTDGAGNLSWVDFAGGLFNEDASFNIVGGTGAGAAITSGVSNFLAGQNAGALLAATSDNIVIGDNALVTTAAPTSSTVIGVDAMRYAFSATSCVAIGKLALGGSTGDTLGQNRTTAVGAQAGWYSEGTLDCVFIGQGAGQGSLSTVKNTGDENTLIGSRAGLSITTGSKNTAIGRDALKSGFGGNELTGNNNTAIGYSALNVTSTTANNNTGIGAFTGANITTGAGNVIVGYNAGPTANQSNKLFIDNTQTDTPLIGGDFTANTVTINGTIEATGGVDKLTTATGIVSVAAATAPSVGQALVATSATVATWQDVVGLFTEDAYSNIVGGTGSGGSLTSSSTHNVVMGINAAPALSTGDNNIIIGRDAAYTDTAGSRNVILGISAARYQHGYDIVAIGSSALAGNSGDTNSSNNSIAIGGGAGKTVHGGTGIFIGTNAGAGSSSSYKNTGIRNVFIGVQAGNHILDGDNNVAIGQNALEGVNNNGITGNSNVAAGYNALKNVYGATANNVAVGANTGLNITTGTGNVILGTAAGPSANQSNRLYIDNTVGDTPLIGGDFAANTVTITGSLSVTGGVDALTTATGIVSVSAATAPTTGQVLKATSGTVATWQDDAVASAATETTAGIVELATQTEVNTGTDTARAVTPATLQQKAEETAMLMSVVFGI